MKYCSKCGAPADDGAAFCQQCGAPAAPAQTPPADNPAQGNPYYQPGQPTQGSPYYQPGQSAQGNPYYQPGQPQYQSQYTQGQYPPPQQPYAPYSPYAQAAVPQAEIADAQSKGTISLVCGIIGLVTGLGIILGIIAIVMAKHSKETLSKAGLPSGNATAGFVCGIISLAESVGLLIYVIFAIILLVSLANSMPNILAAANFLAKMLI